MAVFAAVRLATLMATLAAASPLAVAQAPVRNERPLVVQEGLTGELLANVLLAEVAATRGQTALAANLYLSMAKTLREPRLARRATELAMQAGLLDVGTQAVRLWVELEPDAPGALQTLAKVMSGEVARLEDMEIPLRRLLESETAPVEIFIEKLPLLLARYPDKMAVLALIERLTQPHLRHAESHLVRARAALDAGEDARAERAAQRALDLRADLEEAARLRALAAPAARWTAAMEELGRYGRRFPQAHQVREQHARWLHSLGRKAEALTAYRSLLIDAPQNALLAGRALTAWLRLDSSETAESLARRLLADKAGNVDAVRLLLGTALGQAAKHDEALIELAHIENDDLYMVAGMRRLQLLGRMDRRDEERRILNEMLRRQPHKTYLLLLWQVEAMSAAGQSTEALQALEKFIGERPDEPDVLFEAAMLADKLRRFDDMERWMRRVIELRPDDSQAWNALGYSLADRDLRLPEAERLLVRAVRLSPDSAAIVDSMGWLRFRQGKLPEAIALLRQAQDLLADAEISAHLSEALWQNGQQDEARQVLSAAERQSPDSPLLKELRQRLMP